MKREGDEERELKRERKQERVWSEQVNGEKSNEERKERYNEGGLNMTGRQLEREDLEQF